MSALRILRAGHWHCICSDMGTQELFPWLVPLHVQPATPMTTSRTSLNSSLADGSQECLFARADADTTGATEQLMNTQDGVSWYQAMKGNAEFLLESPGTEHFNAHRH